VTQIVVYVEESKVDPEAPSISYAKSEAVKTRIRK
jgi:hypothetical protein